MHTEYVSSNLLKTSNNCNGNSWLREFARGMKQVRGQVKTSLAVPLMIWQWVCVRVSCPPLSTRQTSELLDKPSVRHVLFVTQFVMQLTSFSQLMLHFSLTLSTNLSGYVLFTKFYILLPRFLHTFLGEGGYEQGLIILFISTNLFSISGVAIKDVCQVFHHPIIPSLQFYYHAKFIHTKLFYCKTLRSDKLVLTAIL